MSLAITAAAGNDSATGGRSSSNRATTPTARAELIDVAGPTTGLDDPNVPKSMPPTTRPVATCETADAAIGRMKWWMGLAAVAVGIAVGLAFSRGTK